MRDREGMRERKTLVRERQERDREIEREIESDIERQQNKQSDGEGHAKGKWVRRVVTGYGEECMRRMTE